MRENEKSREKIEVLAPAGGADSLRAAVFSGADAVYLGGAAFGARANAKNFDDEALGKAIGFCHERGVRVHVTVNTLLKENELEEAVAFVGRLCRMGVDAVLVQDMGLFSLLRRAAPALPLHASTQMSLHTPEGVKLLWELGASRVVLSRELSLKEIREISESCPVELETFVHGALCMCVSGQCYFSAMLGGRSGNRGLCAQPCRLPFSAPGGTGHDLSLRDLSFLEEVRELEAAGVCSAKIEGRMKRPEYVGAAVSACRRAVDGDTIDPGLLQDLEAVFSRSGFTKGYLRGKMGREMFGTRTKEDVAGATEKVFSRLRGLYRGECRRIPVHFSLEEKGERIALAVSDGEGRKALIEGKQEPVSAPLNRERCREQLEKTGGTPFFTEQAAVPEEGVSLSVSGLNALRRQALEALLALRGKREPIPFAPPEWRRPAHEKGEGTLPLWVSVSRAEQLCPEVRDCQAVLLPLATEVTTLERLRREGYPPLILELPRTMFGKEARVKELMRERQEAGFSKFSCGNLGAVELGRELGAELYGSFSLNITNSAALEFFGTLGLRGAEVSFELTGRELGAMGGSLPRGIMIYGRQALMVVRNCPLANSPKGCLHCKTPGVLTDRRGVQFPVACSRSGGVRVTEILNSVPLWIPMKEAREFGDFGVVRFTVENPVECGEILRALREGTSLEAPCTRGLFRRGVE